MCRKHDYQPVFTDKVGGEGIVMLVCKKCGEKIVRRVYVGEPKN